MKKKTDSDMNPVAPRATRTSPVPRDGKAAFTGFVNYTPTDKDKEAFTAWLDDVEDFDVLLSELVGDGWKFTVGYDSQTSAFVGAVARWDFGHVDAGIVLNVRAGTTELLLHKVVFALTDRYADGLAQHVVLPRNRALF